MRSTLPATKEAHQQLSCVSIIIPCYNHARFLGDAVASAQQQTWPHCEIIVIDDGSTDDSSDVARRCPQVTVIRQENRGLAAARNAGFEASRGDVVIFLDADDRLWPDAARIAAETLQRQPEMAMVFGRCRIVDEAGAPGRVKTCAIQGCRYEDLLRDNLIWTPAMAAFRRRALDVVGAFDVNNSPAADYDLYLRVLREFPVVAHEATVADYRQHGDNMSRDPVLMLEATLTVLRAQRPHIVNDPGRRAAYRQAMTNWRATYGERLVERFRTSLRQRRFRAASKDALHLLRLYPAGVRHHLLKKLSLMLRGPGDPPDSVADAPQY